MDGVNTNQKNYWTVRSLNKIVFNFFLRSIQVKKQDALGRNCLTILTKNIFQNHSKCLRKFSFYLQWRSISTSFSESMLRGILIYTFYTVILLFSNVLFIVFSNSSNYLLLTYDFLHSALKVSKYGVISGPYFPVFSSNTGKYGPEITLYLDNFHAMSRSPIMILSF